MDISRAQTIDGWMDDNELLRLATWASEHTNILELGPWKGRSTRAICDNAKGSVRTVDHWEGSSIKTDPGYAEVRIAGSDYVYKIFETNLIDHLRSGKLSVIRDDIHSALLDLLIYHGFEYFDMIFIDAGHEDYNIYKRNLIFSLPLLKENGLICGHDYTYPGAKQALDEQLHGYSYLGNIWWRKSW